MAIFCNDLNTGRVIAQMFLNRSNLTAFITLRGTCAKDGPLHLDFSALWP
jgi:hypothetical protein